jgi:quinolinate synthase
MDLAERILELKLKKNAVILAHYYQMPEIQDIADYIGDSLGLAQHALKSNADIIVFAGVHFMAETAKILNPTTKVILPDLHAGCSLADSCPPDDFKKFILQHPGHTVISYINCSAAVKALSDVICTSSNAVSIVESFPKDAKIIFAPDKNLGSYVNLVTGRSMVLWNGTCSVHDLLRTERIIELKMRNPGAKLIAHPECKAPVLELADFIGSTTAMLNYTKNDSSVKYIVATETGIIHQMLKASPGKEFIVASTDDTCACNDCPYMKMNTMEKLYLCLKNEKPEITIPEAIMDKARRPIQRMMELSRKVNLVN